LVSGQILGAELDTERNTLQFVVVVFPGGSVNLRNVGFSADTGILEREGSRDKKRERNREVSRKEEEDEEEKTHKKRFERKDIRK
jgi:hypothetical protein